MQYGQPGRLAQIPHRFQALKILALHITKASSADFYSTFTFGAFLLRHDT